MFGKNKKGRVPSAKKDFTKLKTPHTYVIIFFVVIACWILTFLIPAGKFSTHEIEYTDASGETATRTVLMADTFRYSYNLDTDFVADALADISEDTALMEEMEVDSEALAALMETDGYSCAGVPLFRRNGYRQSGGRKPLFRNRDTAFNGLLLASLLA